MQCPHCGAGARWLRSLAGYRTDGVDTVFRRRRCGKCDMDCETAEQVVSKLSNQRRRKHHADDHVPGQ